MEVRPILLWGIVTGSALAGAVVGTVLEGVIDKYLMLPEGLEKIGLAQMLGDSVFGLAQEVFSTVIAAVLGAALIGTVTVVIYIATFSERK